MRNGRFITFEGIDGAGKSTHLAWMAEQLEAAGHTVVTTREPGGTPLGEALRELVLREPMAHVGETLLMFASRREHLDRVILPALARGDWVLCDRFTDATFAYQGGGHGVPGERIRELERWVLDDCRPDVTFLFDVPIDVSRTRLDNSKALGRTLDKFENETGSFFDRVRQAYHARVAADPGRFRVIDSARSLDHVRAELQAHVAALAAAPG